MKKRNLCILLIAILMVSACAPSAAETETETDALETYAAAPSA